MRAVFASTVFVSAALLFLVEPMVARMLMPLLGGSPAVWSTCLVFFQSSLLAGYAYAHASTRLLGPRAQALTHAALLGAAALALPIAFSARDVTWSPDHTPVFSVLALLAVRVGAPFLLLSSSAPLFQRWFSLARPDADPYVLYAASNVGSILALLAYPLAIEPLFGLLAQARVWKYGYFLLVACALACAVIAARTKPGEAHAMAAERTPRLAWSRRARWVALSFVPSSLLAGVTAYLGNEIIAVPLLWVVPLVLYLLTFVLAFSPRKLLTTARAARVLPLFATAAVLTLATEATGPVSALLVIHLGMFFVAAMACHGALADDRPDPAHLTEFYAWMSVGGALGGVLNAIVAPAIFSSVVEYPLVIVLACLLRPSPKRPENEPISRRAWWPDVAWPASVLAGTAVMSLLARRLGVLPGTTAFTAMFALPLLAQYHTLLSPTRFALGLGASLVGASLMPGSLGKTLARERGFFGVHRVTVDSDYGFHQLAHGATVHGRQDPTRPRAPLSYYTESGPIGQVMRGLGTSAAEVAVIGLGCGTLAAYRNPAQKWTFYEIDPAVVKLASDPRYFTYLADAFPGGDGMRIVLGDARLRLGEAPDASYDLIVVDAYSSDAIPVHLVVTEAFALYARKMKEDGALAVHLSNKFFDLEPVIGRLAQETGLTALCEEDDLLTDEEVRAGKLASRWCVLQRPGHAIANLARNWAPARVDPKRAWTDDWSYVLGTLR